MDNIVARLIVFLSVFGQAWGLYCYQCDSSKDLDCKEMFDHDSSAMKPTLCSVDAAEYCVKTTGVWGGAVGTTRFCSSRDMFNQCQYVNYADHNRIYRACIYTCKGDGCNSAPRGLYGSLALLLAPIFFFLFRFFTTDTFVF